MRKPSPSCLSHSRVLCHVMFCVDRPKIRRAPLVCGARGTSTAARACTLCARAKRSHTLARAPARAASCLHPVAPTARCPAAGALQSPYALLAAVGVPSRPCSLGPLSFFFRCCYSVEGRLIAFHFSYTTCALFLACSAAV